MLQKYPDTLAPLKRIMKTGSLGPDQQELVQKGKLANQKVINDAMIGVVSKVAVQGCTEPEGFQSYVLKRPEGQPGARVWVECWVVSGCGEECQVRIRFNEAGPNAADWSIQ